MQATERQKWEARHLAGAILSGVYAKIEPKRRHELNDAMLAGAVRMNSVAGWFDHVCSRFGSDVQLQDCWVDHNRFGEKYSKRIDALISGLSWDVLRESVEENPALITMIAKDGPLPEELAPPEEEVSKNIDWVMPVPGKGMIPPPSMRTVWTSVTPMAHGADTKHGNVVLFRREPLVDLLTGRIVMAPFISGNSIRHSWRMLAVDHLYKLIGLGKKAVNTELHHSLTSGGTIDAGSEMSKVDPGLRRAFRALCPAFELLGGIAEKQVCRSVWNVHDAILVCRENTSRLMHPSIFPTPHGMEELASSAEDAVGIKARRESRVAYARALHDYLKPALSFMTIRQYSKHADTDTECSADKMHMIWDTEVVTPGAQWVHYCTVHNTASEFARSCVTSILEDFHSYPYLAAGNNKGHGMVAFDGYTQDDECTMPDSSTYLMHLLDSKDTIIEWLTTGKVPTSALPEPELSTVAQEQTKRGRRK